MGKLWRKKEKERIMKEIRRSFLLEEVEAKELGVSFGSHHRGWGEVFFLEDGSWLKRETIFYYVPGEYGQEIRPCTTKEQLALNLLHFQAWPEAESAEELLELLGTLEFQVSEELEAAIREKWEELDQVSQQYGGSGPGYTGLLLQLREIVPERLRFSYNGSNAIYGDLELTPEGIQELK
jgi:hypothetical protein